MLSPPQMISLATALARKNKINVKFDNSSTAVTDGKTIILPLTSQENSWIVRGYLDHEIGHVRLTDFGNIPNKTPLHKSLWNVLEDIRIEYKMAGIYPGMATNYKKLVAELKANEPGFFEINPGDNPASIFCGYIALLLRVRHLKQTVLNELALKARDVFLGTFGPELEKELLDIVLPYSKVKEPVDVSDMVEALVQLLIKHLQEPEKSEDTLSDPSYPKSADSNSEDDTAQAANSSNLQSDAPSETIQTSTKQALQETLETQDEQQDMGTQLKDMALDKESQNITVAVPAKEKVIRDFGYTPQKIKTSNRLVSQLSANLRGLLQAQDMDNSKPGLSGNRIARSQAHKIKTGEPRLFLRRTPIKKIRTAVHILLDNSTSMRNRNRFDIARQVTLALIKALPHIRGINLGLSVFPAVYPYYLAGDENQIPVAEILKHSNRPGKTLLYPAKPRGSTPLAPSLRLAASTLYSLTEPRKILLIITDGDPDYPEEAEDTIKEALSLGIEVVCLGIEDMAWPEIFPIYEIVKDVKELPHKAFTLFERLLTKQP